MLKLMQDDSKPTTELRNSSPIYENVFTSQPTIAKSKHLKGISNGLNDDPENL